MSAGSAWYNRGKFRALKADPETVVLRGAERVGGSDVAADDHVWLLIGFPDTALNGGDFSLDIPVTGLSTAT